MSKDIPEIREEAFFIAGVGAGLMAGSLSAVVLVQVKELTMDWVALFLCMGLGFYLYALHLLHKAKREVEK